MTNVESVEKEIKEIQERRKERKSLTARHICWVCGESLDNAEKWRKSYCSEVCAYRSEQILYAERQRIAALRRKTAPILGSRRICKRCGKEFIVCAGAQKFCSEECYKAEQHEAKRESRKRKKEKDKPIRSLSDLLELRKKTGLTLDEKLTICKAKGLTYAQYQGAETLGKIEELLNDE